MCYHHLYLFLAELPKEPCLGHHFSTYISMMLLKYSKTFSHSMQMILSSLGQHHLGQRLPQSKPILTSWMTGLDNGYLNLIQVNVKFYILAIKIKNIFTPCKTKITGQREPLVAVTEERDLGVIVDCQLKFQSHTEKIVASANHALETIKQTFTTRSPQTITKLYKSLVRPRLETGMSIFILLLQSGQGHDRESTEESNKDSRQVPTSSLPNETANSELMQYDLLKKKG